MSRGKRVRTFHDLRDEEYVPSDGDDDDDEEELGPAEAGHGRVPGSDADTQFVVEVDRRLRRRPGAAAAPSFTPPQNQRAALCTLCVSATRFVS